MLILAAVVAVVVVVVVVVHSITGAPRRRGCPCDTNIPFSYCCDPAFHFAPREGGSGPRHSYCDLASLFAPQEGAHGLQCRNVCPPFDIVLLELSPGVALVMLRYPHTVTSAALVVPSVLGAHAETCARIKHQTSNTKQDSRHGLLYQHQCSDHQSSPP